jgi:hypothetical protein
MPGQAWDVLLERLHMYQAAVQSVKDLPSSAHSQDVTAITHLPSGGHCLSMHLEDLTVDVVMSSYQGESVLSIFTVLSFML